ncbi:MAG TPA: DUF502 domain-containing protein [Polyangiaceae bacterium]
MKLVLGYFWRGCLVLLPLAGTIYIAFLVVSTLDRLMPVGIPGLGFVLTVALITGVGALTSNVIGRAAFEITEAWLKKLPLVRIVYTSIRDLIDAFVGEKKRFDRPVAVTMIPGTAIKALGFVTRDTLEPLQIPGSVAVYFPQSYNFAGNLLLVPREHIEPLSLSSTDLMTFVVSGGVSGLGVEPPNRPAKGKPARTVLGIGPKR